MIIIYSCRFLAWGFTLIAGITLYRMGKRGWKNVQKLHQIPCSRCQYFTGSYHVKCLVHPKLASTELAIDCDDFVSYNATIG
jgi:hypothetical protein